MQTKVKHRVTEIAEKVLLGVLCASVVGLFPAVSTAEDVTIRVTGVTRGQSYELVYNVDGSVAVKLIRSVAVDAAPAPLPAPNPTPAPSELTARGKEIKALAEAVTGDPDRDNTAKGLALLFRELAKRVRTGQVADKNALFEMVKLGTDMFLTKNPGKWQPVRDKLSVQWSQVPVGSSAGEYAGLLEEVANGLDASAPLRRISPELIDLIFRIIELILSLLNK